MDSNHLKAVNLLFFIKKNGLTSSIMNDADMMRTFKSIKYYNDSFSGNGLVRQHSNTLFFF